MRALGLARALALVVVGALLVTDVSVPTTTPPANAAVAATPVTHSSSLSLPSGATKTARKSTTKATLAVTRSAPAFRQGTKAVTLSVHVTLANHKRPRGIITARSAGTTLTRRAVPASGKVTVRLPNDLRSGTRAITVTFTPKPGSGASRAARTVRVTVKPAKVRAKLTVSRSAASFARGKPGVTVSARVSLSNRAKPAGKVTLAVDGKRVATKKVSSSGTAKLRLPRSLAVGRHRVTLTYHPKASLQSVKRSATVSVKVTKGKKSSSRNLTTKGGPGSERARGADVEKLAISYLADLGARNVTVRWTLTCRAEPGLIYTSGRVSSKTTTVMRLCVSGDFSGRYARNSLRFLVAHEYSHLLYNRAVGTDKSANYQSVRKSEIQADCTAAKLTGLSVSVYGTYTGRCSPTVSNSATKLIRGQRPASLG